MSKFELHSGIEIKKEPSNDMWDRIREELEKNPYIDYGGLLRNRSQLSLPASLEDVCRFTVDGIGRWEKLCIWGNDEHRGRWHVKSIFHGARGLVLVGGYSLFAYDVNVLRSLLIGYQSDQIVNHIPTVTEAILTFPFVTGDVQDVTSGAVLNQQTIILSRCWIDNNMLNFGASDPIGGDFRDE